MASTGIRWKRAAAEIAAIVFGILIAFWIDAAWDRRQEREAEQEILASLESDLQSSLDGLHNHWLPMHTGALRATVEVLSRALELPPGTLDLMSRAAEGDGQPVDSAQGVALAHEFFESLLAAMAEGRTPAVGEVTLPDSLIGAALTTATYDPTVASLDALVTGGDLNRIRDRKLRAALSALPGQLADAQDEERAARDHVDRRLRPLFDAAGDMTTVNLVHWYWLETYAPHASRLVTLRISHELLGALALRIPQQLAVTAELRQFAVELEQTLELIRTQRRSSPGPEVPSGQDPDVSLVDPRVDHVVVSLPSGRFASLREYLAAQFGEAWFLVPDQSKGFLRSSEGLAYVEVFDAGSEGSGPSAGYQIAISSPEVEDGRRKADLYYGHQGKQRGFYYTVGSDYDAGHARGGTFFVSYASPPTTTVENTPLGALATVVTTLPEFRMDELETYRAFGFSTSPIPGGAEVRDARGVTICVLARPNDDASSLGHVALGFRLARPVAERREVAIDDSGTMKAVFDGDRVWILLRPDLFDPPVSGQSC